MTLLPIDCSRRDHYLSERPSLNEEIKFLDSLFRWRKRGDTSIIPCGLVVVGLCVLPMFHGVTKPLWPNTVPNFPVIYLLNDPGAITGSQEGGIDIIMSGEYMLRCDTR